MSRLREFFGLTRAVIEPGYTRNPRAGSMPICGRCGALVAFESQTLHSGWHEQGGQGASVDT